MAYKVMFNEGRPLDLEMSGSVILEVIETDPGVKGDTVTGATKPAKLETGRVVNVPLLKKRGPRSRSTPRRANISAANSLSGRTARKAMESVGGLSFLVRMGIL